MSEQLLLSIVIGFSVMGLAAAWLLARWVLGKSTGTKEMQVISNAIKEGAKAFLRRQFKTIIILATAFAVILFVGYGLLREHREFDPVSSSIGLAFWITLSFVFGAVCSLIAGYIGMWISIRSNIRTAAATVNSLNDALQIALRGGAVSGLLVVSMSLLGVSGLYAIIKATTAVDPLHIPFLIVGYGFGASFVCAPCLHNSEAESTRKPRMSARIWLEKSKAAFRKTIHEIRQNPRGSRRRQRRRLRRSWSGSVRIDRCGKHRCDDCGCSWRRNGAERQSCMDHRSHAVPVGCPRIRYSRVNHRYDSVKIKEDEDPIKGLNHGYYLTVVMAMIGFAIACRWLLYHDSAPYAWICFSVPVSSAF